MNANDYWSVFLETGAPEAYLLYSAAMRSEGNHVSDNPGDCTESDGLRRP